jgi:hypothetical protein
MRGRAWRRYMVDLKVKKRLKNNLTCVLLFNWALEDVCGNLIDSPQWFDWIGTPTATRLKTSPRRILEKTGKWRDTPGSNFYFREKDCRIRDKKQTKKLYERIGFKHFPAELGRELDY